MKILLAFLLMFSWAAIDAETGSLTGMVLDEQGAAIAGAQVTVVSEGSQASFSTTSTPQGSYRFVSLAAGQYRLEVARDGFLPAPPLTVSIASAVTVATPIRLNRQSPQFEAAGVRD
jgi:hypothetical protein